MNARCLLRLLAASAGLASAATLVRAQTTIDLLGATRSTTTGGYTTWKPILAPSSWTYRTSDGYLYDPNDDQQTGQYDSDFAGSSTLPTFFVQTGTINGVEMIAMRVIFNAYDANIASGTYTGNPVNVRVGIDANMDGKLDLYMGPNFQSGAASVGFQLPGTGLNTSPSTTSVSTIYYPDATASTLGGGTAPLFASTNFSYVELTPANAATYYPGWTTQPEAGNKIVTEGMMSWAIPLADVNRALAEAAVATSSTNPTLAGTTISASSFLLWVAFTSTQNNSVNQDAYGIKASDAQTTPWNSFTSYMNSYGNPVPEPSTYGLALGTGLGGFLLLRRRRTQFARAA